MKPKIVFYGVNWSWFFIVSRNLQDLLRRYTSQLYLSGCGLSLADCTSLSRQMVPSQMLQAHSELLLPKVDSATPLTEKIHDLSWSAVVCECQKRHYQPILTDCVERSMLFSY